MTEHFRTCHLCEAMCGLKMTVEDGRVVSVRGDDEDPFSRGHICPKAPALVDFHEDPDRLRAPIRRKGTRWIEVGWDEALDECASRLHQVQQQYGQNAVGTFIGNPAAHNLPILITGLEFLKSLRTRNRFSATSIDQLPHMAAAFFTLGHQLLLPVPDIERCEYMVVLGANPLVSNGSLMGSPDFRRRFRELNERGRSVVIDPRRTETAKAASQHLFIRPGSDAFLLFALVREIFDLGPKLGHLAPVIDGLDALRQASQPFTPERAAIHTGIPAEEIRKIAHALWDNEHAVLYGRLGTSTQSFGGLCGWLLIAVNAIAGNLDSPGGAMFTRPAVEVLGLLGPGSFGRWHSSVRGLPEFGGELPAATLTEEIEAGQIKAMVTIASNPVLSAPGGRALDAALSGLDFMVCIDPYLQETTRHADLILPPCSPLERPHYDLVFNALAIRNTANYSPPIFDATGPHDGQILAGLMRRLMTLRHGHLNKWTLKARALETISPERILDIALRAGPYGAGFSKLRARGKLSLRHLRESPHGVDLGPLVKMLPDALPTKRLNLAPDVYLADVPRLHEQPVPQSSSSAGLCLIGRRQLRGNNSWMHNLPSLAKGKDRCVLLMHPSDAKERQLCTGDEVELRSRIGVIRVRLKESDEMMKGVVSLPHGFGHNRPGARLHIAADKPGASFNDISDPREVDAVTGTAILNGVPVEVRAVGQENLA